VVEVYGITVDPLAKGNRLDPKFFTALVWAVLQTIGLFGMAVSDIDINHYLSCNRVRLVVICFVWMLAYVLQLPSGSVGYWYAAVLPPFVYLAWYFTPILETKEGHWRLTEVFALILALDPVGHAGAWFFLAISLSVRIVVCGFLGLVGPICVIYSYRWSRQRHEAHTISFHTAVYTYLFVIAFGSLLGCILAELEGNPEGLGEWLVGPIHFVPVFLMFGCRRRVHQHLGRRWLQGRGSMEMLEHHTSRRASMGSLPNVEDQIQAGQDLNAYVHFTASDSFTALLMAACGNHLDAVQRLLNLGAAKVDVNKASGTYGHTPIFIAAKLGLTDCLIMLLEHQADIHQRSSDGQTPLIVAAAEGHAEVVQLLMANGADSGERWMGLTAEDSAAVAGTQTEYARMQAVKVLEVLRAPREKEGAATSPAEGATQPSEALRSQSMRSSMSSLFSSTGSAHRTPLAGTGSEGSATSHSTIRGGTS
jgi:hypothetical protein